MESLMLIEAVFIWSKLRTVVKFIFIITPVFSVTWSFRNHSNMLIYYHAYIMHYYHAYTLRNITLKEVSQVKNKY